MKIEDRTLAQVLILLAGELPDGTANAILSPQRDASAAGQMQKGVVEVNDQPLGVKQCCRHRDRREGARMQGGKYRFYRHGLEFSERMPITGYMDTEKISWGKAAAVGIFLPMVINLLVLASYLVTAS